MKSKTLQIDLKPVSAKETFTSFYLDIYFSGICFRAIVPAETAREMESSGLVNQVRGQRHDNGKMIEFEYPDGVDGAGVKYTSKIFNQQNP